MDHVAQLLAESLLRQALAHGVTMSREQAVPIANNILVAFTVDSVCPACGRSLGWKHDRLICGNCGRIAFRVESS